MAASPSPCSEQSVIYGDSPVALIVGLAAPRREAPPSIQTKSRVKHYRDAVTRKGCLLAGHTGADTLPGWYLPLPNRTINSSGIQRMSDEGIAHHEPGAVGCRHSRWPLSRSASPQTRSPSRSSPLLQAFRLPPTPVVPKSGVPPSGRSLLPHSIGHGHGSRQSQPHSPPDPTGLHDGPPSSSTDRESVRSSAPPRHSR